MTDQPDAVQQVTDPRGITFLRSTTTTRVEREADGDTKSSVEHTAHFAVDFGTLPDMTHQYGRQTFRPVFATVSWRNGALTRVHVQGPRVLKSGDVSHKDGSHDYTWGRWSNEALDRDQLPPVLAQVIATYERDVAALKSMGLHE